MTKIIRACVLGMIAVTLSAALASAQEAEKSPQPAQAPGRNPGPLTPLKVQIVIARYQGEKKVSSLPYTLTLNANDGYFNGIGDFIPRGGPTRLRNGAEIPVPSLAMPKESPVQGPAGPVTYKAIGTNIDCWAHSTDDGRFRVNISIEDSSVYSEGQTAQGVPKLNDIPSFRSFRSANTVMLRDGQTMQFTSVADKITGEITKIDVTVTVVK